MRDRTHAPFARMVATGIRQIVLFCSCAMPLPCVAAAGTAQLQATVAAPSILEQASDQPPATQSPSERLELSRDQALWAALAFEDTDNLTKLLQQGADPNKRDELSQMTPLMAAETLPVAKILIEAGADPNLRDRAGRTALHHAAKMREGATIIELLVRMGADVNARADDSAQCTPLLSAIQNYLEVQDRQEAALIIRVLVHLGADVNITDARGNTPLVVAAANNQPELIRLLLELGADATRPVVGGRTPLDFAREANATEAADALGAALSKQPPAN